VRAVLEFGVLAALLVSFGTIDSTTGATRRDCDPSD